MKITELRIGNLVLDSTKNVHKIERLDEKWDFGDKFPIPLTEEWLLKAGFKEIKFLNEYFVQENGYKHLDMIVRYGVFDGHRFLFDFANEKCVNLKYVHQLQNLYFALCGEELVFSSTEP